MVDVKQVDRDNLAAAWKSLDRKNLASGIAEGKVSEWNKASGSLLALATQREAFEARIAELERERDALRQVPPLPKGASLFAVKCPTGEWFYVNHAGTWQTMPNPLTHPTHDLLERLDNALLYEAHGEESDLPERAAEAIRELEAENMRLKEWQQMVIQTKLADHMRTTQARP